MFTGIVTDIGEIVSLTPTAQGQLHRLRIACSYDRSTIADGRLDRLQRRLPEPWLRRGWRKGKTWFRRRCRGGDARHDHRETLGHRN